MFTNPARIGVSISDRAIEMIEIRPAKGGRFRVSAHAEAKLDPGIIEHGNVLDQDRLAAALMKIWREAKPKFSTDTVYVAMPDSITYFHVFHFPGTLSDAEVESALAFQSEEVFPFPVNAMTGDFAVVARSKDETVVQYAVALKESVDHFAQAVARSGLKLAGFGLEAQALSRVLLGMPREKHASLVVDVGEHTTTMFIRDAYGLFASFTSTSAAGSVMTESVARAKNVSVKKAEKVKRSVGVKRGTEPEVRKALIAHIDDLVKEIRSVVHWFERVSPSVVLDELVLAGGVSQMPGLEGELKQRLESISPNLMLRMGDAFARVVEGGAEKTIRAANRSAVYAPALGMALDGLQTGDRSFEFLGYAQSRSHAVTSKYITAAGMKRGVGISINEIRAYFSTVPQRTKLLLSTVFIAVAAGALGGALFWRIQAEQRTDAELAALRASLRASGVLLHDLTPQTRHALLQPIPVAAAISVTPATGEVQGRIAMIPEITRIIQVLPSGTHSVPGVATGMVRLVNDGSQDQPLVAKTRLLSDDGVLFRLKTAVVVPALGSVEAEAYADQQGATGNIGPSHFILPGLPESSQSIVYAKSDSAMTSGMVEVGVLAQADVDAAEKMAVDELKAKVVDAIATALQPGERAIPELTRASVISSVSSPSIGEETTQAEVTVTLHVEALVFLEADLEAVVLKTVAGRVGVEPIAITSQGDLKETAIEVHSFSEDAMRGELELSVQLYPHPS